MTSVLDRAPAGASEPVASRTRPRLPTGRGSKRPVVLIASAFVVFASIAGFASLYASADRQQSVLVVTRTIQQGQAIVGNDLGQARVAVSGGVIPIPVDEAPQLRGRRAVSTIPAGSLLVAADLTSAPRLAPGDAVVGLSLKPGQLPSNGVGVGDQVMVVETGGPDAAVGGGASGSGAGGFGTTTGVLVPQAAVFDTAVPSAQSGTGAAELVSIEVSANLAAAVSSAAVADQVSLVLLPSPSGGGAAP